MALWSKDTWLRAHPSLPLSLPPSLPTLRFEENMLPALVKYQQEQKGFVVNKHVALSEEEKAVVADVWSDYFAFYKYQK